MVLRLNYDLNFVCGDGPLIWLKNDSLVSSMRDSTETISQLQKQIQHREEQIMAGQDEVKQITSIAEALGNNLLRMYLIRYDQRY